MALSMTQLLRKAAETRKADKKADKAVQDSAASVTPINIHQEDPTPYGEAQTGHANRTPVSDIQNEQPFRAAAPNTRTEHADRSPTSHAQTEPDTRTEQPTRTAVSSTRIEHPFRTPEPSTRTEQPQPSLIKLCPRNEATTLAQKTLLRYFQTNGSHVSNYDLIATETGIPRGTVRRVVDKFVGLGMLEKRPWRDGNKQGVYFNLRHNRAPEPSSRTEQSVRTPEPNTQTEQPASPLKKIERKNLSISSETLQTSWPTLARAGFGPGQLDQIEAALSELGKSTERVVQGLDHAEWELAGGKMLDKTGQPVADPCAWVFRSLASQGYYRRPVGYVSAAEQAEMDAEAEAAALAKRREQARQARFSAWLQGLTPEQRREALTGKRGPEEAWLKNVWIERGEPA